MELTKTQLTTVFATIPAKTKLEEVNTEFAELFKAKIANASLLKLRDLLEQVKTERYGLKADINYAQAINFPNSNWGDAITSKWGAWFDLAYRPTKSTGKAAVEGASKVPSNFEFIFLARIISINQNFVDEYQPPQTDFREGNNYDLGLRLVYDAAKFSIEAEYIQRWNRKKITQEINGQEFFAWQGDNTNKFVINMNYNVSKDIVISYNVGKNYDSAFRSTGSLIAGLTVNFGFGGYKLGNLAKAISETSN